MINIAHILQSSGSFLGLFIIFAIIFTESGIPVGFFLPGDTMLFTAGFFAAKGYLPVAWLILVVIVAKTLGGQVGYTIGHRFGRKLFNRPNSMFFRKDYLDSAEVFYEKHGGKTVTFGQFIPVIRTFAPVVAGIGNMKKPRFIVFNLAGAIMWAFLVILLGYWLGNKVPNIDKYLLPVVIIATVFSFAPAAWHLFGKRSRHKKKVKPEA